MKWIDPIVEDVRTARENLWESCGYDLNRLCETLREGQASHSSMVATKAELSRRRHTGR